MTNGHLSNYRRQLATANTENRGLQKKVVKLSEDVVQLRAKANGAAQAHHQVLVLTAQIDGINQSDAEHVDRVAELEAAVAERDEARWQVTDLERLLKSAVADQVEIAAEQETLLETAGADAVAARRELESAREAQTRELLAKIIPLVRKNSRRISNSIEEPLEALYSLWHPAEDNGDQS